MISSEAEIVDIEQTLIMVDLGILPFAFYTFPFSTVLKLYEFTLQIYICNETGEHGFGNLYKCIFQIDGNFSHEMSSIAGLICHYVWLFGPHSHTLTFKINISKISIMLVITHSS